jgi:isoleucyl-tRNA synthetase
MFDLKRNEHEVLKYWADNNVYKAIKSRNLGRKKFYFLDGPPNAYGLAVHHMWVYTIKDVMLKYQRYAGFDVHDRPGFDVHGLPIENRVERSLQVTSKMDIETKIGVAEFVKACRDYVDREIVGSIELLRRFGIFMDFDSVYLPYRSEYISKGWGIFKGMRDKGLLYRDLKPLAYCPRCETVLSAQGPEVEYADETDKSVFVRFRVQPSKSDKVRFEPDTYLVIWTTTPWTLPSNMAIAANPKATYVMVDVGPVHYVVAKERLDVFSQAIGKSVIVKMEFTGTELAGLKYSSPLEKEVPIQKSFNKYHKVLLSEKLVSLSEGTGLLHVAPGHGPEDYILAKQNRVAVFSPVDSHARYEKDAGKYHGLKVPEEANPAVLADLKGSEDLLFTGQITHSYPHCWRCHSKLIFRATEQWFINISKIKKKMLKENLKIQWYPQFAQKWFADAVESSPDWCISRQRYWASPVPIWICGSCKEMEVIGSVDELTARAGLPEKPKDLHKPHIDQITMECRKCKSAMHRVSDVFDVWYDSGVSHTASLTDEEFTRLFPADWITESQDQIRGWFTTLLRTSVAAHGKTPFKRVTIGGMMKDEFGEEVHRSKGNAVAPQDLLNAASVDGFRLWCSGRPRWQDLKLKLKELREADSDIITLYNVAELVNEFAELSGYDLKQAKKPGTGGLAMEDRWILSRLNSLIMSVSDNMAGYAMDKAVTEVRNFIIEDFSRFYLRFAKQRASEAKKPELKRIAAVSAYVLRSVLVMGSIVIPFSTESIYQRLFSTDKQSVFIQDWPKAVKRFTDKGLEADFDTLEAASTAILALREKNNIKLRSPVLSATIESSDDGAINSMEHVSMLIASYTNVKSVKVVKGAANRKEIRPLFQKLGPEFKQNAQVVAQELQKLDGAVVEGAILKDGHYQLHTVNGTFNVKAEHFTIVEKPASENRMPFRYGAVSIDASQTEELKEEQLLREVVRRVQMMRKDLGLKKTNRIALHVQTDKELEMILGKHMQELKSLVKASVFSTGHSPDKELHSKEWEIMGSKTTIQVKKLD